MPGSSGSAVLRVTRRIVIAGMLLYLALAAIAGVVIAEASLRLQHRPLSHRAMVAAAGHERFHAPLQDARIRAADGIELKGWYIHPQHFNGSSVVLLHGITDNREGVAGYGA